MVVPRIALVVLVLFVLAACVQVQQGDQLIGAIYPLTGPQAAGGKQELAGVKAALAIAAANGESAHYRLEVISATTPEEASTAVDRLARDHVSVILGTYGSTLSAAAFARAEELKVVYWETGAVADPITAQRHYVFRTVATGSALGRMAVTFTHDVLVPQMKVSAPRAAVVRVNDIYGRSVGAEGKKRLPNRWAYRSSTSSSTTRGHLTPRSSRRDSPPIGRISCGTSATSTTVWPSGRRCCGNTGHSRRG